MLFYPLHWVPFVILVSCWKAAIVAALYGVVRISQRMVGGGRQRVAMLWTAVGIWFEPVRNTLDLGQVNVFLVLAVLYAACTSRWWLSGLLVGVAAGVKLTPAVTGVYLAGMRRWLAVAASAAAFVATIGLSSLVLPLETQRYFTELLGNVERVGAVGFVGNQSWQGTLSRIVGYDVGGGVMLFAAIVGTAVLVGLAWRALGTGSQGRDALGSLLVIQLFGLTVSPISWAHHWVWTVPLMIWLFYGPWHDERGARALAWLWFVVVLVGVPTFLSLLPQSPDVFSRPWYLAWAEAVYVPMTLATLAWIIAVGRAGKRRPSVVRPNHDADRTENAPTIRRRARIGGAGVRY
jgi:alpha-1,2-mannosyltransferase